MSAATKEREQQIDIERRLQNLFKSYDFKMVKSKFEIIGKKKHGFRHFQRWENELGSINYQHNWLPSLNQYSCNCIFTSSDHSKSYGLVGWIPPNRPFDDLECRLSMSLSELLDP